MRPALYCVGCFFWFVACGFAAKELVIFIAVSCLRAAFALVGAGS